MKQNTGVIEVAQDVHAEGINRSMADQQSGVDAHSLGCRWLITLLDSCDGTDQIGAAKGDASGDGDLAEQVEPACHPGCEGCVLGWCEHERPEVRTAGCGDGGDDFGHAEGDGEGEEGDYEPADGHGCAETSQETTF